MNVPESIRENSNMEVTCRANSANPASSVQLTLLIDNEEQDITPHISTQPGSYKGLMKTYVFTFMTSREQNGKRMKCDLYWDQTFTQKQEKELNVLCEWLLK